MKGSIAKFLEFLPISTRRPLWLVGLLAIGTFACDIAFPWFLKDILSAFLTGKELSLNGFSVIIGIGIARITLSSIHARLNGKFLTEAISTLNKKMAVACIHRNGNSQSASEITSLYTEAVLTVDQFLDSVLWQTLTQGLYCIGAFIIVLYLGGPLVLIAFVPFLIAILASYALRNRISSAINALFSQRGNTGEYFQDLIEGGEILRAYQAEEKALTVFASLEERVFPERKSAYIFLGLYQPIFEAVGLLGLIAILVVGYLVLKRSPDNVANGSASVLYLAFLARTLLSVSPLFPMWSRFKVAVERLRGFFETDKRPIPSPILKESSGIKVSNLTVGYQPDKKILNNFSVEFEGKKVTALVGPNGIGKSTLLKTLIGELKPEAGGVSFDQRTERVAYLPQEPFLFRMSLLENLRLTSPHVTEEEVMELSQELGLQDFLKNRPNGLNSLVGGRGTALSGGERQKISLLRFALRAKQSEFCFLDEPTSYIDLKSEEALMKVVLELCAGKTTIVVSHRPWLIEKCDRVIQLGETSK